MADLNYLEKMNIEKFLGMESGYVLQFSNKTFKDFFKDFKIQIYSDKYTNGNSGSKGKILKSFLEQEQNDLVGTVLMGLFRVWQSESKQQQGEIQDKDSIEEYIQVIAKLKKTTIEEIKEELNLQNISPITNTKDFLDRKIIVSLDKLPCDQPLIKIIKYRLTEAEKCIKYQIPLGCIFLCGSILEGVLLAVAKDKPEIFNKSKKVPKNNNQVKKFADWTLNELIEVAYDIKFLDLDIKKYSTILREFRNYIHPFEEEKNNFSPTIETAKISLQVVKSAINCLSNKN